MALNFGGAILQSEDRYNISGAQFDPGAANAITIVYVTTSVNEETIYTVPAGKTLFISKILFVNLGVGTPDVNLELGGYKIYNRTNQPAGSTEYLDFPFPMIALTGTVISGDFNLSGNSYVLIGWLS